MEDPLSRGHEDGADGAPGASCGSWDEVVSVRSVAPWSGMKRRTIGQAEHRRCRHNISALLRMQSQVALTPILCLGHSVCLD